jgi:predicted dehydrogenase
MRKVRWGVVSTANINKKVIPAIRESHNGELIAVASRKLSRAKSYAAEWDIPKSYGNYQEMLDSGEVDAVYISLPNHLHAEWSIKALEAGVHVLCEKPFAITLAEIDAMIDARKRTNRVLAEAFMYLHHPQTRLVAELIQGGRLGDISLIRSIFNFRIPETRRSLDNLDVRLVPEFGGGCLWDVGVYPISICQYVFGEPPKMVFGSQWTGETGVDETFCGQLFFSGNRLAQISSSFRTSYFASTEIIGTQGRLYINSPFAIDPDISQIAFYPHQGEPEIINPPTPYLYLGEIEDMHNAILDGSPNLISLDETRNHVRTVLALYESAKNCQPEELLG